MFLARIYGGCNPYSFVRVTIQPDGQVIDDGKPSDPIAFDPNNRITFPSAYALLMPGAKDDKGKILNYVIVGA